MRKVEVRWIDICSFDEWIKDDDIEKKIAIECQDRHVITIGYLYKEDEKDIILFRSEMADKEREGMMIIPKGVVKGIKYSGG